MLAHLCLLLAVLIAGAVAHADEFIVRAPLGRGESRVFALHDLRLMELTSAEAEDWIALGFRVEKNHRLRLIDSVPGLSSVQWGLDAIRAREANSETGGSGEGVTVCVVDTGIDLNHPALAGSVVGGMNYSDEGDAQDIGDRNGHGTHLSGIIAGRDVGNFRGVAPLAKIYVSKAFQSNGGTNVFNVAKAIRGCFGKATIMNFSFGAEQESLIISEAIDEAAAAGITMLAAVGNHSGPVGFPARHPRVIAVSSMTKAYKMAPNACRGTKTAFFAPGNEIFGPVPGGYRTYSGTSMATAFASGVEAIRQSRNRARLQGRLIPSLERPLIDAVNTAGTSGMAR